MSEFWFRLLSGFIGAIVSAVVIRLWSDWRFRRGDLSGKWIQYIDAYSDQPQKQDKLLIRHNHVTRMMVGKINRSYPENQEFKEWEFEGRLHENLIFIIFWAVDLKQNSGSYGTIQLQRIDEGHLRGFYIRAKADGTTDSLTYTVNKIPLEWKRES